MTTAEWIAFGQMLTGMLGVGLVGLGLHQMRRAGDQREKREDARHREAMAAIDARHRESMRALEALIKGLDQQGEALRSQGEALRSQGETSRSQGETLRSLVNGLDRQTEALKVVIERTAPPPGETP